MKNIVLIPLFFIGLIACEKEIKLNEKDIAPRIVVNSQFKAGESWVVFLAESRSLLNNQPLPIITNGSVQLYNDAGDLLGDFENKMDGNYILNVPKPAIGNSYQIRVNAPSFKMAEASSYVPKPPHIISIDTLSLFSDYGMKYKIKLQDEKNVENYYSVRISGHGYWIDYEGDTSEINSTGFVTTEYYVENGYTDPSTNEKYAKEFYFSDKLFDGEIITFNAIANTIYEDNGATYKVLVKSLSEDLYKYYVTLAKYEEAKDDFFAEPVRVVSNIKNGFGIFGGVSEKTVTFTVE